MIDMTVPLRKGMSVWEGDPEFEQSLVCSLENGDEANVSKLTFSSHAGTHIDAPSHYIQGAKTIDQINIDSLFGECEVISIPDENINEHNLITQIPNFSSSRIILKTNNSIMNPPGTFDRNSVALSLNAANQLIEKNVKLVGIDGLSIETADGNGEVHRALLSKEIVILETLDLTKVNPGQYELICLPIKIIGCDAAPTRAFLKRQHRTQYNQIFSLE